MSLLSVVELSNTIKYMLLAWDFLIMIQYKLCSYKMIRKLLASNNLRKTNTWTFQMHIYLLREKYKYYK